MAYVTAMVQQDKSDGQSPTFEHHFSKNRQAEHHRAASLIAKCLSHNGCCRIVTIKIVRVCPCLLFLALVVCILRKPTGNTCVSFTHHDVVMISFSRPLVVIG